MSHFVKHTSFSKENSSLLIFDNHKTQLLNVGIFKSFKDMYNATMESWMMRHFRELVTIYDVGAFICDAYHEATLYYECLKINGSISFRSKC